MNLTSWALPCIHAHIQITIKVKQNKNNQKKKNKTPHNLAYNMAYQVAKNSEDQLNTSSFIIKISFKKIYSTGWEYDSSRKEHSCRSG